MSRIIAVAHSLFAFASSGLRRQSVVENLYQADGDAIADADGNGIQVKTWHN